MCEGGRLLPVDVNGTAGFGNYHRAGPGQWEPWAIQVIEVTGGKIVGHTTSSTPSCSPSSACRPHRGPRRRLSRRAARSPRPVLASQVCPKLWWASSSTR